MTRTRSPRTPKKPPASRLRPWLGWALKLSLVGLVVLAGFAVYLDAVVQGARVRVRRGREHDRRRIEFVIERGRFHMRLFRARAIQDHATLVAAQTAAPVASAPSASLTAAIRLGK